MFFTKENSTLYLSTWNYNAALIIEELRKIVINNGGRVKPTTTGFIVNRAIDDEIQDKKIHIEKLNNCIANADSENQKAKLIVAKTGFEERIAKLQAINNDPIHISGAPSYITFIYEGIQYYYQTDNNPFFEFYFTKAPIKNNKVSLDIPLTEDKKEWLYDCFFFACCSRDDIVEAANMIFNMLVSAPIEKPVIDKHKRRVTNLYDSGYHYEWIAEKERFQEIDF